MIKSMTAFARKESQAEAGTFCWELRSVNHRFLDLHFRLPELFRSLEPTLREKIKKNHFRGKMDVSLNYQPNKTVAGNLALDTVCLGEVKQALETAATVLEVPLTIDGVRLLQWPGVLEQNTSDAKKALETVLLGFDDALVDFSETQLREGEKLKKVIELRLNEMQKNTQILKEQVPALMQAQRQHLMERLAELNIKCDPERLEQEVALLAQKSDVAEEIDRLFMHIEEMFHVLKKNNSNIGRRLDFLAQEMHREANTLGSKSSSRLASQTSLELKVLIEQVREQVQNIE